MAALDFKPFDADNHYYEATDAFTRHIDPKMAKRAMQWAEIDGKRRLLVGGKVNKFIPNPLFDPIARPGSLEDYFRGRNTSGLDLKTMFGELDPLSDHPGYQQRDARVRLLDEQGLTGALLFPTLGVGMQDALQRDPEAMHAAFDAFNKWLDDDWGYDRGDGRLYAAPMISFCDVELATAEVTRVLDAGAKVLVMVPGPVPDGSGGWVSPGHPKFDPIWSLLHDSGVPLVFHAGLSGITGYGKLWGTGAAKGAGGFEGFKHATFPMVAFQDRAISDTLCALLCHGVFDRYPNVRVASIENGAMWVPDLLRNLEDGYGKMPFTFGTDPVERFHSNIWVAPYYEDDMDVLKDAVGIDHLLFGSDFPHAEGLPDPVSFTEDIPTYDASETRKVMLDNVVEFITPRPT